MGENQTEKKLKRDIPLGEALNEVMNLSVKYNFTDKDLTLLGDRLMVFGEAVTLITEMGMYEEFCNRIIKKLNLIKEAFFNGKQII